MKKALKKVSIGIPAYNEQANIVFLLNSILGQNQRNIDIMEILVISDGSTDNTVQLVKDIEDKRIKIFEDSKRLGKSSRVNQLMKLFRGEYLVMFDADVVLKNNESIENLLSSFDENKKIGVVCGNLKPLPANSFIGRCSNNLFQADNYIRNNFKEGHNIFSALGAMIAIERKLAKMINLPSNSQGDDMFLYLSCKAQGLDYRRNTKADVYFKTPQSISDFIKQSSRQLNAYKEYENYFNSELIRDEMTVPLRYKIRVPLYQALKNPAGWIFLKILAIISRQIGKHKTNSGIWDSVSSTKLLF